VIVPKALLDVCSVDATRSALAHIYLDLERKRAVATNGPILAALAIEPEEGEVSGYLSKEAVLYAATHTKGQLLHYAATTVVGEAVFPNPFAGQESAPPYPDYHAVIPTGVMTRSLGIDAALLVTLAKVITAKFQKDSKVELRWTVGGGPLTVRAFTARAGEDIALIMPLFTDHTPRAWERTGYSQAQDESLASIDEARQAWDCDTPPTTRDVALSHSCSACMEQTHAEEAACVEAGA
jgi:hypothetical protein